MALEAVPDPDAPQRRGKPQSTTTSFRIPTYWFDKVKEEAEKSNVSMSAIYTRALTAFFDQHISSSWETTDEDFYDPNRFYTHSEDKKGHSFHLRAPIPKPFAGELHALIKSGAVPQYRSLGDIVRDALFHRVKAVSQMIDDGTLESSVDMMMLLAEEIQMQDEAETAEHLIDAMHVNAQGMWARGDHPRLKRYLAGRMESAENLVEPYRSDYIGVIKKFEKMLAKEARSKKRKKRERE